MIDGSEVVLWLMAGGIAFMILSGYEIAKWTRVLQKRNYEQRRAEICKRRAMRQRIRSQKRLRMPDTFREN